MLFKLLGSSNNHAYGEREITPDMHVEKEKTSFLKNKSNSWERTIGKCF